MAFARCPLCGSKRIRPCRETYVTRRGRRQVVVRNLEIHRCDACGEGLLTDEAMRLIDKCVRRRVAA
ncbi:MAG: YgiT-type zinc finger protein [Deltaproteobacteria bacterium]|nr:YgiT-type zinc finger protein [Deltaproteobacteria bacterium]